MSPCNIINTKDTIIIKHNTIITTDNILEQSIQLNITLIPNAIALNPNVISVIIKIETNI